MSSNDVLIREKRSKKSRYLNERSSKQGQYSLNKRKIDRLYNLKDIIINQKKMGKKI